MAYGKKSKISDYLYDYSFCLLGESGIGKTTTIALACEEEFGEDGYMIFNAGKEQGIDCLDGFSYEDIENWKKFDAVTKDIIKNKEKDYPDLKVVVFDTLDQIIEITEPEAIKRWNQEGMGKKDFVLAKTLNASWGGFGHGEDKVIEIILDRVWELLKVGVRVWYTGHVKTREIVDPITNQTYTTLSTNMMTKYFNGFKTKMHVVGIACVDRTIETEKTGRKNIVTKKDITVNKVKEERRKIVFRDDNYSTDSKSRFSGIVDEIPLDADELLKALHDAIENSKRNKKTNKKIATKSAPASVVEDQEEPEEIENVEDLLKEEDILEEDLSEENVEETETESVYPDNLLEEVMKLYKASKDAKLKKEVREIVKGFGRFGDCDNDTLQEIYDMLNN